MKVFGLIFFILSLSYNTNAQQSALVETMEPFTGNWKAQPREGQEYVNYRRFEWGLNKKVMRFFEAPGPDKVWMVESIITWNPVHKEIQANDWTNWGNYVSVRLEKKENGFDRLMTVYNATDQKTHHWVSSWRWVNKDTWKSQAREVDEQGNTIQEWPEETYGRIKTIPKSIVKN